MMETRVNKGECKMKAYMTNGTVDFLLKLNDQHPNLHFHLMTSPSSTLAYYEGNVKNVFVSGRAYDVLIHTGELQEDGFVVMNNIPVTEEGRPVFEERFKKRQHAVDAMPGFQAFRLLKPHKGNTYIVFTQWRRKVDYENWKNSEQFSEAHKKSSVKPPAYFADRPFLMSYHMYNSDEEEE